MRALLDTNIVIHRENQIASNYSIGHLFRWLDKLNYKKVIHSGTISEIERFKDQERQEALRIKLEAYEVLRIDANPPMEFIRLLPPSKSENDDFDNALLYEVYKGYVDILITEDRRLRQKANDIGISAKVFSIESFIGLQSELNPDLIEYRMLAVEKRSFREINFDDSFFDSFRRDYPGFNQWFKSKSLEFAYVCEDAEGSILGFLYLKPEGLDEDYTEMKPPFLPKKRLKIGTFKVESTGFRLGERFVQLIFDNARRYQVEEIYVTIVEADQKRPELTALIGLLESWGFDLHGKKVGTYLSENVYTKSMKTYKHCRGVKANFPIMQFHGHTKRFLPIFPEFHTDLFPDSILRNEDPRDYESNVGFRYALQKRYITWASLKGTIPGDYVLVYRTGQNAGRKKYESTVTTLGLITEVQSSFTSEQAFLQYCSNRTVFTEEQLREFWLGHSRNMTVVTFILVKSFDRRPILGDLWDAEIVQRPYGPRPFDTLTDSQFLQILEMANTPVDFSDRSN